MATTHNISHALTWFSDGGARALTEADEEAIRHDFANGIKLKLRRLTHACQIVIQAVKFTTCIQGQKLYNSGCVVCDAGTYQDFISHTLTSCKTCTATCGFGKSHSCSKTSGSASVSYFFIILILFFKQWQSGWWCSTKHFFFSITFLFHFFFFSVLRVLRVHTNLQMRIRQQRVLRVLMASIQL